MFELAAATFETFSGKGYRSDRTCGRAFVGGASYEVCTASTFNDSGVLFKATTSINRNLFGYAATYYSKQYRMQWGYPAPDTEFRWSEGSGTTTSYGDNISVSLRVSDSTTALAATGAARAYVFKSPFAQPYSCRPHTWGWATSGQVCAGWSSEYTRRYLYVMFPDVPPGK